jgi:hypothetical protein
MMPDPFMMSTSYTVGSSTSAIAYGDVVAGNRDSTIDNTDEAASLQTPKLTVARPISPDINVLVESGNVDFDESLITAKRERVFYLCLITILIVDFGLLVIDPWLNKASSRTKSNMCV